MHIKKLKKLINNHEIISFDIFDTLLLRPYIKPVDLFFHLEKISNKQGFAKERIDAELRARQKFSNKEDISYDDIYNEINPQYAELKDKELALEFQVLQPNPEIKEVFDYAIELGKKIIITSDMYLSKSFLEKLLENKGFGNYSKFYLSSDIGKTKWNGSLYAHIVEDLKVNPKEIFHIGDNIQSDYKRAKKQGLKVYHYPKAFDRLRLRHKKKFKCLDFDNINTSILVGVLAINALRSNYKANFWGKIGYEYGGISCYAYMKWLEEQAKQDGIKDILFVARDGYSLKKVFDSFNTGINTHYVYAPRFLNLICTLDYDNQLEKLNIIINYYKNKSDILKNTYKEFKTLNEAKKYFNENIDLYMELATVEKQKYKTYLERYCINPNQSCTVDSFSFNFSAQKLISKILDNSVKGYYWQTSEDKVLNYSAFFKEDSKKVQHLRDWNFMEFIMTAPEYPIQNVIDNKPIYKDNMSKHEVLRKELCPLVSKGIIDFANDINTIFNGIDIKFENMFVVEWINLFADFPLKEEKKKLRKVKHAIDSAHNNYVHLFPYWYGIKSKILLFGTIPIGQRKKFLNKEKYYLFGIPILKKKYKNNNAKYYLFNFIYLIKIKGVN